MLNPISRNKPRINPNERYKIVVLYSPKTSFLEGGPRGEYLDFLSIMMMRHIYGTFHRPEIHVSDKNSSISCRINA